MRQASNINSQTNSLGSKAAPKEIDDDQDIGWIKVTDSFQYNPADYKPKQGNENEEVKVEDTFTPIFL